VVPFGIGCAGLRRTCATLAADAGKSLNHLQLALGHRSITTTQMYLMANEATAAREMAGCWPEGPSAVDGCLAQESGLVRLCLFRCNST
jgi:integrase